MTTRKPTKEDTTSSAQHTQPQEKVEKNKAPSKVTQPKVSADIVTVNITLTVPKSTSTIKQPVYLCGNLHQIDSKQPDWDPKGQKMKKVDDQHWTLTLKAPEKTVIEYKYTLGDWDHVEKGEHDRDIPNRRVVFEKAGSSPLVVEDRVQEWFNL
jgi:hypothetical protein